LSYFIELCVIKETLATDYRFFDVPHPVSPSEIQLFQQFLSLENIAQQLRTGAWPQYRFLSLASLF
jgi:hypothetical protein